MMENLSSISTIEDYIMDPSKMPLRNTNVMQILRTLATLPDSVFTKIIAMISQGVINIWDFQPILSTNDNYNKVVRSSLENYIEYNEATNISETHKFDIYSRRDILQGIVKTYFRDTPSLYNPLSEKMADITGDSSFNNIEIIDMLLLYSLCILLEYPKLCKLHLLHLTHQHP